MPERLNINQIVRMPQATNFSSFRQHINNIRRIGADFDSVSDMFANEAIADARRTGDVAGKNAITFDDDGLPVRADPPKAGGAYVEAYQSSARQMLVSANQTSIRNKAFDIVSKYQNDPSNSGIKTEFDSLISIFSNSVDPDVKSEAIIDLNATVGQAQRKLRDLALQKGQREAKSQALVDIAESTKIAAGIAMSDAGFYYPSEEPNYDDNEYQAIVDPKKAQVSAEALKYFRDAKTVIDTHFAASHIDAVQHMTALDELKKYMSIGTLKASLGLNQENLQVGNHQNFYVKLEKFVKDTKPYLGRFDLSVAQRQDIAGNIRREWSERVKRQNAAHTAYKKSQKTKQELTERDAKLVADAARRPVSVLDLKTAAAKHGLDLNFSTNSLWITNLGLASKKDAITKIVNDTIFIMDNNNSWLDRSYMDSYPDGAEGWGGPYGATPETNFEVALDYARGRPDLIKKLQDGFLANKTKREERDERGFKAWLKGEHDRVKDLEKARKLTMDNFKKIAETRIAQGVRAGIITPKTLYNDQEMAYAKLVIQADLIADKEDRDPDSAILLKDSDSFRTFANSAKWVETFNAPVYGEREIPSQGIELTPYEKYLVDHWDKVIDSVKKAELEEYDVDNQAQLKKLKNNWENLRTPTQPKDKTNLSNFIKKDLVDLKKGEKVEEVYDLITNQQRAIQNITSHFHDFGYFPAEMWDNFVKNNAFESAGNFLKAMESIIQIGFPDNVKKDDILRSLPEHMPTKYKNMVADGLPIVLDLFYKTQEGTIENDKKLEALDKWMFKYLTTSEDEIQDINRQSQIATELANFDEIFNTYKGENAAGIGTLIFGSKTAYEAWSKKYTWTSKNFPTSREGIQLLKRAHKFYRNVYGFDLALSTAMDLVIRRYGMGVSPNILGEPNEEDGVISKDPASSLFAPENNQAAVKTGPYSGTIVGNIFRENNKIAMYMIASGVQSSMEMHPEWGNTELWQKHFHEPGHMASDDNIKLRARIGESNNERQVFDVFLWSRVEKDWILMPEETRVIMDSNFGERLARVAHNFRSVRAGSHSNPISRFVTRDAKWDSIIVKEKYKRHEGPLWHGWIPGEYAATLKVNKVLKSIKSVGDSYSNSVLGDTSGTPKKTGRKYGHYYYDKNVGTWVYATNPSGEPFHEFDKQASFMRSFDLITELEDFRAHEYPDGKWRSIGHGTSMRWLTPMERDYLQSNIVNGAITEEVAGHLTKMRMGKIFKNFLGDTAFKGIDWPNIHPNRMAALTAMAYQVGIPEFSSWKNTLALIKKAKTDADWEKVAKEIVLNSAGDGPADWVKQTPNRVRQILDMLEGKLYDSSRNTASGRTDFDNEGNIRRTYPLARLGQ